jgi:hypothetical protein
MFTDFSSTFVLRKQAEGMAADRTAAIPPSDKTLLLEWIDEILDTWKLSIADGKGLVRIEPDPYTGGLLGAVSLSVAAGVRKPSAKLVPVTQLKPEQCAGPNVASKAELVWKLWLERYSPVVDTRVPVDVLVAVLMEHEAETMPLNSLAHSIRNLWLMVWSELELKEKQLVSAVEFVQAQRKHRDTQLAAARIEGAKRKRAKRQEQDSKLWSAAVDYWKTDLTMSHEDVAKFLRSRGFKLAVTTIIGRTKGTKGVAAKLLATTAPSKV